MSQSEKSTKRIVSKTKYIALRSKRATLSMSGILVIFAVWSGVAVGVVIGLVLIVVGIISLLSVALIGVVEILLGLGIGYLSIRWGSALTNQGIDMIQRAETMDIGVPFTQANASDLPPSDSLVRASSEPEQEQESVLLRASIHSQQTPVEQLLRPAEGQEA